MQDGLGRASTPEWSAKYGNFKYSHTLCILHRHLSTSANRSNWCQANSYRQSLTIVLEWWIRPISSGKRKWKWQVETDCFPDILWATLEIRIAPSRVVWTLCLYAYQTHKYKHLPSHEVRRFLTLIVCIGKRLGLAVCHHLTYRHSLTLFWYSSRPFFCLVFLFFFTLSCLTYLTHWQQPPCSQHSLSPFLVVSAMQPQKHRPMWPRLS